MAKEDLTDEVTGADTRRKWGSSQVKLLGKALQEEGLRSEHACCVQRTSRKPGALSRVNNGVAGKSWVQGGKQEAHSYGTSQAIRGRWCYSEWYGMLLGIFSKGVTRYYLHCRKITPDIELRLYMQGRREQKSKQLGACKNPWGRYWWLRLESWQWKW